MNTHSSDHVGESDERPVRVLHLSDFHLHAEKAWDSDPVLRGLSEAIHGLVADGLTPDAIAITGDLAHKGLQADYDQAAKWIADGLFAKLPNGFPRSRLLLVPGNHDVDRSTVKTVAQSTQTTLLEKKDQDTIAAVLGDSDERDLLLKRHARYLDFVNGYRADANPLAVPWWSQVLQFDGVPIHFVGLCSSWMCWSDEDHGRLLVGEYQANPLLNAGDEAAFHVVLMHHPWDYLAEFDSRVIEPLVHRRADLLLRGHLHRERARLSQDPDDVCLELAAGSVYDGGQYANAFQLVEIFPAAKVVRVHYRVWHKGRWIPDRNAYQAAEDGIAIFRLQPAPSESKPPARAVSTDSTRYLTALRERTGTIDIRGLQVGSGRATAFPIDELYIPLTTTMHETAAERSRGTRRGCEKMGLAPSRNGENAGKSAVAKVPVPIFSQPRRGRRASADSAPATRQLDIGGAQRIELHQALGHQRLVIIGDPGSGKTTFLRRIASLICRTLHGDDRDASSRELGIERPPLPVLIRIADLVEHIATARQRSLGPLGATAAAWLAHYLATASNEAAAGLDEAYFRAQLESGGAVVMFDGLDEAPSFADRRAVLELIEKAVLAFPECRFVLTSRPGAYQKDTVLSDFVQVQIDPLEDETVRGFLGRWCEALFPEQPARCGDHLRELLRALESRPEIRRMARNPVMLTALAVVHWNEKRLPEQRADLYESIITWLARSREHRAGRASAER
jgi:predicted MPP superfamily phosphohydrolase